MSWLSAIPVVGPILDTVKAVAGLGGKGIDAYRDVSIARERNVGDANRISTEGRRDVAIADIRADVDIGTLQARLAIADQARRINASMRPALFYVCLYRATCEFIYFSQPKIAEILWIEVTTADVYDTLVLAVLSAVFVARTYEKNKLLNSIAPASQPRR